MAAPIAKSSVTMSAPRSLWLDDDAPPRRTPLPGDLTVDVLVIGGGIAGITTALLCARDGARVAVVEARRVASGVTGCNTAKVSALQSTIYSAIRSRHGEEAASVYAQASTAGVERIAALASEQGIDCALHRRPAFTYAADESQVTSVEKEAEAARTAGLPVALTVASGFMKWGLSGSTFAAILISDLVAGRENPWAPTFDPTRLNLRSLPTMARINGKVAIDFVGDRVKPSHEGDAQAVQPGEARVVRDGLGRKGVYRDDVGTLHAVSLRCTHLGCLLRFNSAERSWDCPCHGSRFAVDGSVLEGPATKRLQQREP
jgi:Rieske Fe-S protein